MCIVIGAKNDACVCVSDGEWERAQLYWTGMYGVISFVSIPMLESILLTEWWFFFIRSHIDSSYRWVCFSVISCQMSCHYLQECYDDSLFYITFEQPKQNLVNKIFIINLKRNPTRKYRIEKTEKKPHYALTAIQNIFIKNNKKTIYIDELGIETSFMLLLFNHKITLINRSLIIGFVVIFIRFFFLI